MGLDFEGNVSAPVGGWVGSDGAGPRRGRYLELPQLLKLASQVAGAALEATQVQLHLQTADGSGLPRGGAAG